MREVSPSAYNTAVVAIQGSVDMADGVIDVEARPLKAERALKPLNELAAPVA